MHLLCSNISELSADYWVYCFLEKFIIFWAPAVKPFLFITNVELRPFGNIVLNEASINQLNSLVNGKNVAVNNGLTAFGVGLTSSVLHILNSFFEFNQRAHSELEIEQNKNVVGASWDANIRSNLIGIDQIELGITISQILLHLIWQILLCVLEHVALGIDIQNRYAIRLQILEHLLVALKVCLTMTANILSGLYIILCVQQTIFDTLIISFVESDV